MNMELVIHDPKIIPLSANHSYWSSNIQYQFDFQESFSLQNFVIPYK